MRRRMVVVVGYDGAELLDTACVTTTLNMANQAGVRPPVAAARGHPRRPADRGALGPELQRAADPRALLTSTALPMTGVARRCGFGSAETLRQAFIQLYGTSPARYRAAHGGSDPTEGSFRAAR